LTSFFFADPITSVSPSALSPTTLVSTLDSTLRLFDRANGQLLQSYKQHTNTEYRIRSCLGLNDAVVVSGSEDGSIYAWDLLEAKVVGKMEGMHGGKVPSAVAWNGRGEGWASAGGDGELDISHCRPALPHNYHQMLVLTAGAGTVCVWGMP
jgi:mitogen-activated protein kinase organizer 1